jgi:hypothetical protein
MDTNCPGCGKRLKDIKAWEKHAKGCNKLEKALQRSYNIPAVSLKDLSHLEVKLLPNGKEWGIWNINSNDWIRDKSGQIDSRLFQRNIKTLLNSLVAVSIIADARNH